MTQLRKKTVALLFGITALAISALGGSFVFLHDEIQTAPTFIETHLEESKHFDVEGARKANYSDQEIVTFIVKKNQAEFDRQWYRLLSIVGALYIVLALGIIAITFRKESNSST